MSNVENCYISIETFANNIVKVLKLSKKLFKILVHTRKLDEFS